MQNQTGGAQPSKFWVDKIVGIDGACFRVEMSGLGQVLMPVELFKSACKDAPKLWAKYVEPIDPELVDLFKSNEPHRDQNELDDQYQERITFEAKKRTREAKGARSKSSRLRRKVRKVSYKE